jgi:hypothetical protein
MRGPLCHDVRGRDGDSSEDLPGGGGKKRKYKFKMLVISPEAGEIEGFEVEDATQTYHYIYDTGTKGYGRLHG